MLTTLQWTSNVGYKNDSAPTMLRGFHKRKIKQIEDISPPYPFLPHNVHVIQTHSTTWSTCFEFICTNFANHKKILGNFYS